MTIAVLDFLIGILNISPFQIHIGQVRVCRIRERHTTSLHVCFPNAIVFALRFPFNRLLVFTWGWER